MLLGQGYCGGVFFAVLNRLNVPCFHMPSVLHSLNSLRMLTEFCVVHVHLADNFGNQLI